MSMRSFYFSLFAAVIALVSPAAAADDSPVPRNEKAKPVNIAGAGEGPAWHSPSRSLYFVGGNRITRLDPDGKTHIFREPSGGANGLLFDKQGRLVVCEAGNRRIARTESDGSITVLAALY